ncbi:MAG: chromophore lyase CpcT/CpeT, partial [Pseudanabaenaceae cyanobacterium bins.68]|nr:chromophore lyase CpcT/CpeT [Pseudanabaenaceae cyanobacterium bins.68]
TLTLEHLEPLPGCDMQVTYGSGKFSGQVEPGKNCCVFRNGKNTYLSSEFEVTEQTYSSLDRGNDPETDERVWGSIAGAFEFKKKTSFAAELGELYTPHQIC